MVRHNVDITQYTTFGIPVTAKYFAEYSSVKEMREIIRSDEYQSSEVLHIGGGSNLLFVNNFDGLILHSSIKGITEYRKDDATVYVIAGAAENWIDFVNWCVDKGLGGLENLAYIPGEVGASAVQNVGAYGVEAKDVIYKVECYDFATNSVVTLDNAECKFGYRDSIFKHEAKGRYAVLRVCFKLVPSDMAVNLEYGPMQKLAERNGGKCSISQVRDEVTAIRKDKLPDPSEVGSAGSFFKNPIVSRAFFEETILKKYGENVPYYDVDDRHVKVPAGWLIEQSGLKGYSVGGAQVYNKQALVIINHNNASAQDVVNLSEHVCNVVHDKFNILLKPEVNFIDTSIEVVVLGSGTSKGVPEMACRCEVCQSDDRLDHRLRASLLVKTHGMNILIDASPDLRMQALNNKINSVDAVLLTHGHYDHVGGIDDLRPYCGESLLPVYAKQDVVDDLHRRIDYCFRESLYPGVPTFKLHTIDPNRLLNINGLRIEPINVNHGDLPILGYRIGKFAYITDAKSIDAEEVDKLRGVEVLIVNALRYKSHFSHFSVDEALELISKIKPKEAYLTHINHDMGLHRVVNSQLPEGVQLAYDNMVIKIS